MMESKSSDGRDNVISSLPTGTPALLESEEILTRDGHDWCFIRIETENEEETGWVLAESVMPDEDVEAPPTTVHVFTFGGKDYVIFEDKLFAAIGQFIFKNSLPGLQPLIIDNDQYFTSQDKINAMKDPGLAWIEEIQGPR
jgi:hypothetical protein